MARLPRISPVGIPVHLIQRGNNRQICFAADEDYVAYLNWLKEYSIKFSVDIHAWVLMTNHVHVLCTPRKLKGTEGLFFNQPLDPMNSLFNGVVAKYSCPRF